MASIAFNTIPKNKILVKISKFTLFGPLLEKTCPRSLLRPSKTETSLLRYRDYLEYLGDNCIQNGEVYRRIYVRKFSFTATRERSRKT